MKNIYDEQLKTERVINLLSSRNTSTGSVFRTFLVRFPKILLAELNTHRMLVRNCGSSRAIPTQTFIENIKKDPYIPTFTKLQAGMTGIELDKDSILVAKAKHLWQRAIDTAIFISDTLREVGIHKQNANRLLEPFSHVDLVLSGTEWTNFIQLRTASDTQPDFKHIADKIMEHIITDVPVDLEPGEWHIPFKDTYYSNLSLEQNIQVCIARIARVSYMRHGSDEIELEKDIELAKKLLDSGHLSPLEHVAQAVPLSVSPDMDTLDPKLHSFIYWNRDRNMYRWTRNYSGFYTYRHHIEDGETIE